MAPGSAPPSPGRDGARLELSAPKASLHSLGSGRWWSGRWWVPSHRITASLRGSAWIEVRFSTDANHAGLRLFGIQRLAIRLRIPQPILASTH